MEVLSINKILELRTCLSEKKQKVRKTSKYETVVLFGINYCAKNRNNRIKYIPGTGITTGAVHLNGSWIVQ